MKKLLFLLLIWLYPIFGFGAINEYLTDVYYANGMQVNEGNATASTHLLELSIVEKIYAGSVEDYEQNIGKVEESYNSTHGFFPDLIESAMQKLGLQFLIDWYALLKGYITSHLENIRVQINAYKSSITHGHKVLVVAHSQGNFFTGEAYTALGRESKNGWMQNYFEAVSIASPRAENIKDGTARIDWDNDPVSRIATRGEKSSLMTDDPTRKVSWESEPYIGEAVVRPSVNYVDISQLNTMYKERYKAVEDGLDFSFNVHAFKYYMGEDLEEGKILNPFNDTPLQTNKTKDLIMAAINKKLNALEKVESQWKPKNLGCLCKEKYAKMTHRHDPENIKFPATNSVKDFAEKETGKIYQVNGKYVRALEGGVSIEEVNSTEACYVLKDDVSNELGKIKGLKEEPSPQDGIITVKLTWEDSEIDMNLEVDMPFGEQDIKDTGCPLEHFYVAIEDDIEPGTYPVYVNNSNIAGDDESLMPKKVNLVIHTPGEAIIFDFEITDSDMLDLGHVADIIITEEKKVHFVNKFSGKGNPPKVIYYGSKGSSGNGDREDYSKYRYTVQSKLKQALLGPLSNAAIELTEAKDFQNNTALYTGVTSGGDSLLTSGLLYFPRSFLHTLSDEKYYVVSITGGTDIDTDDDGKPDSAATPSDGTIRTILSGRQLKNENFKVTLLTETLFQLTKELLSNDLNTTTVAKRLDAVTQKLLIFDVNKDGMIDYNDALWWLPMFDKGKLLKPYAAFYQPMVEKVYRDEDIYDDAYALIHEPYLREQKMHVSEDAEAETIIGKVHIDLYEGNATYRISGKNSSFFTIDDEGVVTLSNEAKLDYETKRKYDLNVTIQIGTQILNAALYINIDDIPDAPELGGFISYIDEKSPEGTSVGKLHVDPGSSSVTKIELQGEGSEKFTVDLEGNIAVAQGAILDYAIQKSYQIYAVAYNRHGHSLAAEVQIILQSLPGVPVLKALEADVKENTPSGSVIGNLIVIENGSLITSMELSGEGHEAFNIETNGTVTLSPTAQLDYSSRALYTLQAQATNATGVSTPVRVTINITNISEGKPVLNNTILNIEEHAAIGTIVGTVEVNSTGVSPIEYMTLSGVGAQKFNIDKNGIIKVADTLDYESKKIYTLNVSATSQFGTSDMAELTIAINNILEVPPVLHDINVTLKSNIAVDAVVGNILKEAGDKPIDEFIVAGSDMFGIHTNGDIYLKKPLYENNQTSYIFNTYAKSSLSKSNSVTISIKVVSSILDTLNTSGYAIDITLSRNGKKAYIADGKKGLQIIDVSNISEPQIIGSVDTPDYAMDVVLSLDGMKAFIADGYSGLQIIDISDVNVPEIIGSINTLGYAHSITLSKDGTEVLIADGSSGLQIIDVSNPAIPEIIGSLNTPDYAQSIALSLDGTKAFIADGSSGLQIVDVSNPAIPVIISTLDTPGYAVDIALSADGTKVFIADSGSGLQVVDIYNPALPVLISSMDTFAYDISLSSDGTKVFLVGSSNLQIVDIIDITAPSMLTSLDIHDANAVVSANDDANVYVASGYSGLQVVDIRQIELEDKVPGLYAPPISVDEGTVTGSVVGQVIITYSGNGITSIQLKGDGSEDFTIDPDGLIRLENPLNYAAKNQYNLKMLATNNSGTREVDVLIMVHTVPKISDFSTTVNSMTKSGTLVGKLDMWVDDENTLHSIVLSGEESENFTINTKGEIYVAPGITLHHFITPEYNLSLVATNAYGSSEASKVNIDVSAIVASMEDHIEMKDVLFSSDGTKAYMLNSEMELQIIDISDVRSPKILQVVELPDYAESMVLSKDENRVFLASYSSGLQIVDISDVRQASVIGSVSDLTYAYDVVLSSDETKAFIADASSGLKIVDISDPTAPQVIGSLDTGGKAQKVVLSIDNSKVFIGNNDYPDYKLQVIDVTDPMDPVLTTSLDTSGEIASMAVAPNGTELFVANWSSGLQIIDIDDPETPTVIHTMQTDGALNQLTLSPDGTKIIALNTNVLQVIDVQEPMNPIVLGTVNTIYYSEGIDVSSDGMQVIVGDWRNGVYVIDLTGL